MLLFNEDLLQDGNDRNVGSGELPWTVGYFYDLFAETINGWLNPKGVHPDGDGFKHQRVPVATLLPGADTVVDVAWQRDFVDTNYTVLATPSHGLSVGIISISVSGVSLLVTNTTLGNRGGSIHLAAIHD